MRERTVLVLVVVLVASTAAAGVAVNLLRPAGSGAPASFQVVLDYNGTAAVGSPLSFRVVVQALVPNATAEGPVFLSLDVGTMRITASTPGSNPWGYPSVWNLTGLDLSAPVSFNVTAVPTDAGTNWVYAMVWTPKGDLASVSIDASGHVNPIDVFLESVTPVAITVTAST